MFGSNTTIWICACCNARYWLEGNLANGEKEYMCPICGHLNVVANFRYDKKEEE